MFPIVTIYHLLYCGQHPKLNTFQKWHSSSLWNIVWSTHFDNLGTKHMRSNHFMDFFTFFKGRSYHRPSLEFKKISSLVAIRWKLNFTIVGSSQNLFKHTNFYSYFHNKFGFHIQVVDHIWYVGETPIIHTTNFDHLHKRHMNSTFENSNPYMCVFPILCMCTCVIPRACTHHVFQIYMKTTSLATSTWYIYSRLLAAWALFCLIINQSAKSG